LTIIDRRLVRARLAVCVVFACHGTTLATWAVHLPALQRATGMSTAMVGTVLLITGVGALIGMQICGPLTDRLGSFTVAPIACVAMAVSVIIPLTATTTPWALGGALAFGVATGCGDVAMNAAAVAVERAYDRPILSSCHAVWSLGNAAGSLLSTIGFVLGLTTGAAASVIGVLVLAVLMSIAKWLKDSGVADVSANTSPAGPIDDTNPASGRERAMRVLILGSLAFLLMFSEGAAMDWSSLHAQQHLRVAPQLGAVAFGCFVTAMTVGRFSADRIAARIGPVAMLRRGAMLALVGIATVILAPNLPLALAGWLVYGLGLAGGIPQVFSAAGNSGDGASRILARVVGMCYVAVMAGPALVGWLAQLSSLNTAFLLPLGAVAVCALAASAVRPR
jgi:MFS family permease